MDLAALLAALGSFVATVGLLGGVNQWRIPLLLGRRLSKIKEMPGKPHPGAKRKPWSWERLKPSVLRKNSGDPGEELELAILSLLGSLRAGASLVIALREAAEDAKGPVKAQLTSLLNEYDAGIPLSDCLRRLGDNRELGPDGPVLGAALEVLRITGANATEALMNLATTIRERRLFRGELRSKTADVRISATILRWMPVALTWYIFSSRPALLGALLQSRAGRICLGYSLISWVVGVLLISRLEGIDIS